MKRQSFITIISIIIAIAFCSFSGCNSEKGLAREFVDIVTDKDCARMARNLSTFIKEKGERWKKYIVSQAPKYKVRIQTTEELNETAVMMLIFDDDVSLIERFKDVDKCDDYTNEMIISYFQNVYIAVLKSF